MSDSVVTYVETKVGPLAYQGNGAVSRQLAAGRFGELLASPWLSGWSALANEGKVFSSALQAEATFGTALTATAVTLTLYNPRNSPVNLVLISCGTTVRTCSTAGHLVLAANTNQNAVIPATNTEATVVNARLGGPAGYGIAYSATTLPAAPTAVRSFAGGITAAGVGVFRDYIDGALVLLPNTAITLQGITVVGTGIIDFCWAELPNQ